jgi:hypothetical protein
VIKGYDFVRYESEDSYHLLIRRDAALNSTDSGIICCYKIGREAPTDNRGSAQRLSAEFCVICGKIIYAVAEVLEAEIAKLGKPYNTAPQIIADQRSKEI